MRFALVKRWEDSAGYWLKDLLDNYWEDLAGQLLAKTAEDFIVEYAEADSNMDLDWKKTGFYVANGKIGWLAPNGIFYGCDYCGHSALARYVIKQELGELEIAGWAHIDCAGRKGERTFRMDGEPTTAQKKWLMENGHDLDPYNKGTHVASLVDPIADALAYERMMAEAAKRKNR